MVNKQEYINTALQEIHDSRQRQMARQELEGHLADREEYFRNLGFSTEEAEARAVTLMGNPAEVSSAIGLLYPDPVLTGKALVLSVITAILPIAVTLATVTFFTTFVHAPLLFITHTGRNILWWCLWVMTKIAMMAAPLSFWYTLRSKSLQATTVNAVCQGIGAVFCFWPVYWNIATITQRLTSLINTTAGSSMNVEPIWCSIIAVILLMMVTAAALNAAVLRRKTAKYPSVSRLFTIVYMVFSAIPILMQIVDMCYRMIH